MPGRPPRKIQAERLKVLGVNTGRKGTLWTDTLDRAKRHRTAGQTQLTERNGLIKAAMDGDKVIIADPMCLGVSPLDGEWFLAQLSEKNVTVMINGELYHIEPGRSTAAVIGEFARRLNVFNARKSRGQSI